MDLLNLADVLQAGGVKLLLVTTRVAGIFSFAPILSSSTVPRTIRAAVVLAISLLISVPTSEPAVTLSTMVDLIIVLLGELLIGLILGAGLQIIFMALQFAGQVAGIQVGLALASVVNPQFDDQVSTIGLLYLTVASLAYIITGADRELFAAVLETFYYLPLGQVFLVDSTWDQVITLFRESMHLSMRIAAPVTVAMLLTEVAMGFVGRTVPQLNVLSVGFALRIIVGLFITMAALGSVLHVFDDYVISAYKFAYEMFEMMRPG